MFYRIRYFILSVLLYSASAFSAEIVRPMNVISDDTSIYVSKIASEYFGQLTRFRNPVVSVLDSGRVFEEFCGGVDYDVAIISRPISKAEEARCGDKGVALDSFILGYGAPVFVNNAKNVMDISYTAIYHALTMNSLQDGVLTKNLYTKWSQIDPAMPDAQIQIYGPSANSLVGRILIEDFVKNECMGNAELRAFFSDNRAMEQQCGAIRSDGKFIEYDSNTNFIVQKIKTDVSILGIMSYIDFLKNSNDLSPSPVEGILPSAESIKNRSYLPARAIFFYYKREAMGQVEGLQEFINELKSKEYTGYGGYLSKSGLFRPE